MVGSPDAPTRDRRKTNLLEVEAILALGSLIVFAAALWAVLFNLVPAENEKYIMLMLGALIGVVKDTFGRYFQATAGSQEQRRDFAELAKTAAGAVSAPSTGPQTINVAAPLDPNAPVAPADTDLDIPPAPRG